MEKYDPERSATQNRYFFVRTSENRPDIGKLWKTRLFLRAEISIGLFESA